MTRCIKGCLLLREGRGRLGGEEGWGGKCWGRREEGRGGRSGEGRGNMRHWLQGDGRHCVEVYLISVTGRPVGLYELQGSKFILKAREKINELEYLLPYFRPGKQEKIASNCRYIARYCSRSSHILSDSQYSSL